METGKLWAALAASCLCLAGTPAAPAEAGQEAPPTLSQEEVVEKILELKRQLDELLAQLPPELSQELRARLAEPEGGGHVESAEAREPSAGEEVAAEVPPPKAAEREEASPSLQKEPPPPLPPSAAPGVAEVGEDPDACNTLQAFDGNGDFVVSGADRFWRHLYLWTDRDRDQTQDKDEVKHVFEHDVREISLELDTYKNKKGAVIDIEMDQFLFFYLVGSRGKDPGRGVLLVDATGLERGGGPELLSPEGETLDGLQPWRKGLKFRGPDGSLTVLNCP